jgi:hypothetical protein
MKTRLFLIGSLICIGLTSTASAVTLSSVGSQMNIGTDLFSGAAFFPGGTAPYQVVRWRDNELAKTHDIDGDDVYGTAGYFLFGTKFVYPHVDCCGSQQPFNSPTWPNLVDLPDFVSSSQNLTEFKVGGWPYALVDDPRYVNGGNDPAWHTSVAPTAPLSQQPYVMMGTLDGWDMIGNNPVTATYGAARWAFEVGADVPESFRLGVMTDGLNDVVWTATEVYLAKISGTSLDLSVTPVSTGTLVRNRFVDMHFFDILDAQPGDRFVILSKAASGGTGGIAGVSFDVTPIPEPATLGLTVLCVVAGGLAIRRRNG